MRSKLPFAALCAASVLWLTSTTAVFADAGASRPRAGFAGQAASADARYAADFIASHADNQNMPYVIVDKKSARVFVFAADGQLRGATTVLLGLGIGDQSVPGIAQRAPYSLKPLERTTPAGRFVSEPGHNLHGEEIVWIDYEAKIAIHRLRPDSSRERRAERMASASLDDKRISLGCVVVPVDFYEGVLQPVLGRRYGVVYVLPENSPVENMFGPFKLSLSQP